jgi:hypothetical protein
MFPERSGHAQLSDQRSAWVRGVGVALFVMLSAWAQARPPCAHTVPLPESTCFTGQPEPCIDRWIQENQSVWVEILWENPPFTLYDSFAYSLDEECSTTGNYTFHNHTGQTAALRVHDLVDSEAKDPAVAANMCQADMDLALATNSTARVVFGEMIRGLRSVGVLGLVFSRDPDAGARQHRFLIIRTLSDEMVEYLRGFSASREQWMAGQGGCYPLPPPCIVCCPPGDPDCNVPDCCDCRWRDRSSEIFRELIDCIRDMLVPIGLPGALCILACTASGPLMPACIATCLGATGIAGMIDFDRCTSASNWAKEKNLISYCACIEWKETHCSPGSEEPPVRDCP